MLVNQKRLVKVLSEMSKIKLHGMPILENVLINNKGIYKTNLDVTIFDKSIKSDISFCVNCKQLLKVAKSYKKENINFEVFDEFVKVEDFKILSDEVELFPIIPEYETINKDVIDNEIINLIIEMAKNWVAGKNEQKRTQSVNFDKEIAATDGNKILELKTNLTCQGLLHSSHLKHLEIFKKSKSIDIIESKNKMSFIDGSVHLMINKIDEPYLKYKMAFDKRDPERFLKTNYKKFSKIKSKLKMIENDFNSMKIENKTLTKKGDNIEFEVDNVITFDNLEEDFIILNDNHFSVIADLLKKDFILTQSKKQAPLQYEDDIKRVLLMPLRRR